MPRPAAALLRCRLLLQLLLMRLPWACGAEYPLQLPAPQNVTIHSYNFQNVLRWAPVEVDSGTVLYTVQYTQQAPPVWEEINCTNITKTECNFTYPAIGSHWTISLHVRAELGEMKSDWVETSTFVAARDTTIGPPVIVNVTSTSNSLLLRFLLPFKRENLLYHVYHWKKSTNERHLTKTKNNQLKLQELDQTTEYCFQIQAVLEENLWKEKIGLLSDTHCQKTTASDLFVVMVFIGVIVTMTILATVSFLLIQKFHKAIKSWFQVPLKIPPHFGEYLMDPEMHGFEEMQNNYAEETLVTLFPVQKAMKP
ncbi:interferon gamma receptor 2 [Carettochelys insculpta]|uniref:interferon gamma receptor 2 n=1 Tax=Carettochelys insculpta TaxID=44489 RepID=UPI003EBAFB88